MTNREEFRTELEQLINKHSLESGSNTPDFILAQYLEMALNTFDVITQAREHWYGRHPEAEFVSYLQAHVDKKE